MPDQSWYTERQETDDVIEYKLDRRQFMAVAGALTGVSLAGCTGGDDPATTTADGSDGSDGSDGTQTTDPDTGGDQGQTVRLNVALPNEVWQLDPGLSTNTSDDWVIHQMFEAPTQVTTSVEIEPQLANSLPSGQNGATEFVYEFDSGIEFHNGDEMTAADWDYSLNWMLDPDNNSPIQTRIFPDTEGGEIIDDYTYKVIQSSPFATWNAWVQRGLKIVPEGSRGGSPGEYGGPTGLATDLTKDPSGAGTGPFQFVEWVDGQHILIEANENYREDGVPAVDEIQFSFTNETSTRISQLRAGQQDIISLVPPKDVESLDSAPSTVAGTGPGRFEFCIFCNLMPVDGNPIANMDNRKAIHYAIDRMDVVDNVFYGTAKQSLGMWHPESQDTSPRLREMAQQDIRDLDLAQEHLDAAGNPDGFEVDLLVTQQSTYEDSAIRFQSHLEEVGITLNVSTIERGSFYNHMYERTDWHLLGDGWGYGVPVISYPLYGHVTGNEANHNHWHAPSDDLPEDFVPGGPPVPDEYADEYDHSRTWANAMLDEGRATTDDQARREIFWEVDEYCTDNCVQLNICYESEINAWRDAVQNYTPSGVRKDLVTPSKQM